MSLDNITKLLDGSNPNSDDAAKKIRKATDFDLAWAETHGAESKGTAEFYRYILAKFERERRADEARNDLARRTTLTSGALGIAGTLMGALLGAILGVWLG